MKVKLTVEYEDNSPEPWIDRDRLQTLVDHSVRSIPVSIFGNQTASAYCQSPVGINPDYNVDLKYSLEISDAK